MVTPRPLGRLATLALAASLLGVPATAAAQDVAVRAYLSPGPAVGVGSTFVLNVEVSGTQQVEEPQLPDLGAFAQYLGSNTQSSMRVVNGVRSVSLTLQYRYQALAEGSYRIPGFYVVAGGETNRTEPLAITVSSQPAGPGGQPAAGGVAGDDLFITAEATRTRVFDGEPLVVEYRIWTRVDVTTFNFTRVPEPEGFWVEDITPEGQPQVQQLTRNGQQYASAVIRRVVLVPTGVGRRTVDPIVMEAQVRTRGNDPLDRFFGRSLFSSSTTSVGVVSDPIEVVVDPLPPGAPEPFSGVVGGLGISATLDRDSVAANDAVTLTVTVQADGNVRAIPAPELDLPDDFEAFPPEVSESVRPAGAGLTGAKTFEYVLIPRAPGQREIPAMHMSWFDRESGQYRVATAAALPLTVTGVAAQGPAALARGGVSELRQDIRFIHLGASLRRSGPPLFEAAAFWILLFLPMAAVAGALALRQRRDRLEGDVAYARGRRAGRVAKKRLAEARRLAQGEDRRAFYAEVARALRGLVADKLNLAEAGIRTADLESALSSREVGGDTVRELVDCLGYCDRQRFAPPAADREERERFLGRAAELMTTLDRALGR